MEAIELLIENHLREESLNLIRSVYENYLQIPMAIHAPEQLKQEIQARIGLLNKTYTRKKNSFTTLIEIATQKEIRLWTGAHRATLNPQTKEDDLLIYQDLYNMLSPFTHPDVSLLNAYVNGNGFSLWEKISPLLPNFIFVTSIY